MKAYLFALMASAGISTAAQPALPTFAEKLSATANLSLAESLKGTPPPPPSIELPRHAPRLSLKNGPKQKQRYTSAMPMMQPKLEVDPAMIVPPAHPNPDPEMIKEPTVEPSN